MSYKICDSSNLGKLLRFFISFKYLYVLRKLVLAAKLLSSEIFVTSLKIALYLKEKQPVNVILYPIILLWYFFKKISLYFCKFLLIYIIILAYAKKNTTFKRKLSFQECQLPKLKLNCEFTYYKYIGIKKEIRF